MQRDPFAINYTLFLPWTSAARGLHTSPPAPLSRQSKQQVSRANLATLFVGGDHTKCHSHVQSVSFIHNVTKITYVAWRAVQLRP